VERPAQIVEWHLRPYRARHVPLNPEGVVLLFRVATTGSNIRYCLAWIAANMNLKAEYVYVSLKEANSFFTNPPVFGANVVFQNGVTQAFNIGRVGLNWTF
jgi:hypothetical protein